MSDPTQPNLVIVDIYGNGYNSNPTQRGVATFPIDPNNTPTIGDHVAVSTVGTQPYSINSGGGSQSLAKISNIAGAPTIYQVDIYDDGFTSPATGTAKVCYPVDLAAAAFGIGDQVSVFKAAGKLFIDTSHPWTTQQSGTVIAAKITSVGSAPSYGFVEVTHPGDPSAGLKPGGITGIATEWSGRGTGISMGFIVRVEKVGADWFIDLPIGTAGGGA